MAASRKTTRRQFLAGTAAADHLAQLTEQGFTEQGRNEPSQDTNLTGSTPQVNEAEPQPTGTYLLHIARRAMACEFAVFLNAGQHERATEHVVEALDLIDQLEDQLSIYRETSEICEINRSARAGPVTIEENLCGLIENAIEIYQATDGAFDITSGPLSKLWGDVRRQGRIPTDDDLKRTLRRVGGNQIQLDAASRTIRFLGDGMQMNLGGIGKGYALDRCIDLLSSLGINDFLIHGGQSSVAARGSRVRAAESTGWPVGLKHPLRPEVRLAEVQLRNRALGTSGSASHAFRYQGRRIGHILDPRSGQPAEGVLSATVLAPSAATADALSTAFYVLGVERSLRFCEDRPQLAAILVTEAARRGSIELHSRGLAGQDWQRLAE